MKILFMASDNNKTSGAFLSMIKLNEIIQKSHGIETLVVLPNEGDGSSLLAERGIPYTIISSRNWIVDREDGQTKQNEEKKEAELQGNKEAICRIRELIRMEEVDVVHINTSYTYVGAEAAIEEGRPFIWHIREFLEEDQNRKIWNREKGYALMNRADVVITISNSIYEKYSRYIDKKKLYTIYNGIDEEIFYKPVKKIFVRKKTIFTIVGGILPYKGQTELIRACSLVRQADYQDFELRLIGKGKESNIKQIKELSIEAGLKEQIKILGAREDIAELLEDTDILFVCSKMEAFGRVTVEGMMAGCLVIGADTAGTKEILSNRITGLLYEQGNPEDLAEKIIWSLENKEAGQRMAEKGRDHAVKNYTAVKNANAIMKLYGKLGK